MTVTDAPTTTDADAETKSRTYYEEIARQNAFFMASAASLDQKIAALLQSAPVVTTLLIGLLVAAKDGLTPLAAMLAIAGVAAFVAAMIAFFAAQRPRPLTFGLNAQEIAQRVAKRTTSAKDFHDWLAFFTADRCFPANERVLARKSQLFNNGIQCFILSTALMLVAVLICLPGAGGALAAR